MLEITDDLINVAKNGGFSAICHGCNCFNTMGAGIAAQIAREFPGALAVDQKTPKGSYNKLGTLSISQAQNGVYIINAYTQFKPGPDARMNALEMCLDKIAYFMKARSLNSIGFPLIGAGIGGLDPLEVIKLLRDWSELNHDSFSVTLVHYGE